MENSRRRVPQMDYVKVTRMINGPEAFTSDNEFCLGETEIAGLFVAAGFCAHGLAGAGRIGRVMAEWIAEGEPSLDLWHMDIRRFGRQYRSPAYTVKRPRDLRDLLRHPLSAPRARVRPSPACFAGQPLAPRARCRLRREVGLGAGQLVRGQRSRETMTAPAGLGRAPLVAGHRRRAPGVPGGGGTVRRELVRQARALDRAPPSSSSGSATTVARDVAGSPTPRCSTAARHRVRLHRGTPEDRFGIVTGTAFGNHDREWIRRHPPGDGSVQVQDLTSASACFGIWGRGRATCSAR